jgi:hypothetical protein
LSIATAISRICFTISTLSLLCPTAISAPAPTRFRSITVAAVFVMAMAPQTFVSA